MKFVLAIAIATSFWTHHGVRVPCHPTAEPTPYSQFAAWGAAGAESAAYHYSETGDCRIFLSPAAYSDARYAPRVFCLLMAHEVGNLAGVPENLPGQPVTATWMTPAAEPPECVHWRHWRRTHWGY